MAKLQEQKESRKQVDIKLPYNTETQENLVRKLIDQTSQPKPTKKAPIMEPVTQFQLAQSSALQFNGVRVQIFAAVTDTSDKIPTMVSEVDKIVVYRRQSLNRNIINPN